MNENEIQFLRRTVDSFGKSYKPHFHQFGIPFIVSLIQNVPALKIELDQLVSRHKSLDLQSRIERVWNNGSQSIGEVMPDLKDDYSLYVTFCWQWLLHAIERGNGNTSLMRWQGDDNVENFVAGCIEPILAFLERANLRQSNGVFTLERYKIFCERYDEFPEEDHEEKLTKKHLAGFLFHEGYTYVLAEVLTASGRIDNIADIASIDEKAVAQRDDAIVIEAKIAKDATSIKAVYEQLKKRLDDLGVSTGFAIIYCKEKMPVYEDASGTFVFPYYEVAGKRIYFINVRVNLNEKIRSKEAKSTDPYAVIPIKLFGDAEVSKD